MPNSLSDFLFQTIFRAARTILGVFPLRPWLALCDRVGRFTGRRFSRETNIALAQIGYVTAYLRARKQPEISALRPGHSLPLSIPVTHVPLAECEPAPLLGEVFGHIGRAFGEAMAIERFIKPINKQPGSPLIERGQQLAHVTSTGQERVYEILDQGKALVALSGHIGCFELLAAYHVRVGVPLSVVGRVPNVGILEKVVRAVRGSYGVDVLWRDDPTSARRFMQAVKEGRVIAALIDQDTSLESAYSSYFGIDAAIPIGVLRLALRYKLPVFSSFIVRTGYLDHHVITEEIPYDPADPDAIPKILDVFSSRLEELVCRYPDQWLWWHRRWRRRPGVDYNANPETLPSSANYVEWMTGLAAAERAAAGQMVAETSAAGSR